jgi:hypothetical protein
MSSYFDGQCDYCGEDKSVKFIMEGDAVRTKDAEDKIRKAVEGFTGRPIVGCPKLCSECFVKIARRKD